MAEVYDQDLARFLLHQSHVAITDTDVTLYKTQHTVNSKDVLLDQKIDWVSTSGDTGASIVEE